MHQAQRGSFVQSMMISPSHPILHVSLPLSRCNPFLFLLSVLFSSSVQVLISISEGVAMQEAMYHMYRNQASCDGIVIVDTVDTIHTREQIDTRGNYNYNYNRAVGSSMRHEPNTSLAHE